MAEEEKDEVLDKKAQRHRRRLHVQKRRHRKKRTGKRQKS